MKKSIIIFLLLSLLLLSSCTTAEEPPVSEVETTAEQTQEVTLSPDPGIRVAGNDISEYTIIHDGTKAASELASDLRLMIYNACGCRLDVRKHTASEKEYEILIGKTEPRASKSEAHTPVRTCTMTSRLSVTNSLLWARAELPSQSSLPSLKP